MLRQTKLQLICDADPTQFLSVYLCVTNARVLLVSKSYKVKK